MKLNVCCGLDYREGYVNIDFSDISSAGHPLKVDRVCDITKGIDLEDNCASEIVFRESLEHFNRWVGLNILKELYRLLAPGGVLDLTVPPSLKQMKILLNQLKKYMI